jgi:hypothetical protein
VALNLEPLVVTQCFFEKMRLMIDKQPEGTRSPNLADAVVMAYWPVVNSLYDSSMEWV